MLLLYYSQCNFAQGRNYISGDTIRQNSVEDDFHEPEERMGWGANTSVLIGAVSGHFVPSPFYL